MPLATGTGKEMMEMPPRHTAKNQPVKKDSRGRRNVRPTIGVFAIELANKYQAPILSGIAGLAEEQDVQSVVLCR